jgi:long-chain acyl-CoA synthetase
VQPLAPVAGASRGDVNVSGSASTRAEHAASPDAHLRFPSWNRWPGAWLIRRLSLPTWILPLARVFFRLTVTGREHLRDLHGPVIFAANHQSHMDVPAILIALPSRWRYRVATAMSREFFYAHFHPRQAGFSSWLTNTLNYFGACMFFNTFPLAQSGSGTRQTLRYMGDVVGDGYSILIFPEGQIQGENGIAPFRSGIGMIASRLDLPVVPVRIEGLNRVLPPGARWPKRGPIRVSFAAPLALTGGDYVALAQQVEDTVRGL